MAFGVDDSKRSLQDAPVATAMSVAEEEKVESDMFVSSRQADSQTSLQEEPPKADLQDAPAATAMGVAEEEKVESDMFVGPRRARIPRQMRT